MINAIVTKLNSQLPDAQIAIDKVDVKCNSKEIIVHYTASNFDSTKPLPAAVPIAIYINDVLAATTQTQNQIDIGGIESGTLVLQIPDAIASPFDIRFEIDNNGNGIGQVAEIIENNNSSSRNVSLVAYNQLQPLSDLTSCNEGFGSGTFDFSVYEQSIKQNPTDVVSFYNSIDDLQNNDNPILDSSHYEANTTPSTIFVKVDNGSCFQSTSFNLKTTKCQPIVYNYVSANDDGINDTFTIKGLRDVFTNFKLEVYNRWGKLVWTGNNNTSNWDGKAANGIVLDKSEITDGTYFYSLELNDADFPAPLYGFLFLNH
jgi:gliding motility-associated-like protein